MHNTATFKLQDAYKNLREFRAYSQMYGLAKRLGFRSAIKAWKANPTVQCGVNPRDYKTLSH